MSAAPQLNASLDRGAIARSFQDKGRTHIPAILAADGAARVQHCLEHEVRYALAVGNTTQNRDIPLEFIDAQNDAWRAAMMATVFQGARDGFQFFYDTHRMSHEGEPYPEPGHYLAAIVAFLNSEPFLSFAREVTGMADIAFADAQATRYGRTHFLTLHTDSNNPSRRVAYVLNMTPGWRADWGGLLLFLNENGHVAEGYTPAFNALNLFKVPQLHLVSQVAPFAGRDRHCITGWLRART